MQFPIQVIIFERRLLPDLKASQVEFTQNLLLGPLARSSHPLLSQPSS